MAQAGSDKFDDIVRDPLMREIHRELAGGACMLSGARAHYAWAAQCVASHSLGASLLNDAAVFRRQLLH